MAMSPPKMVVPPPPLHELFSDRLMREHPPIMKQEVKPSMDLVNAINHLEALIRDKEQTARKRIMDLKAQAVSTKVRYLEETEPLQRAIEQLRKDNTVCEYCHGSGDERYTDAAGDTDTRNCSYCHGSGEANYKEQPGRKTSSDTIDELLKGIDDASKL